VAEAQTFSVELAREAQRDLEGLAPDIQRNVAIEIQRWLSQDPFRAVKTRSKRLSGFVPPVYRLRIGDYRAYYRILPPDKVVILAIFPKRDSQRWLRRS
jgi:mRNA-degrading endonuclease RelE of RelBE toxin-antitoxin system